MLTGESAGPQLSPMRFRTPSSARWAFLPWLRGNAPPAEPPCAGPHARWCGRDSSREPTYADSVREGTGSRDLAGTGSRDLDASRHPKQGRPEAGPSGACGRERDRAILRERDRAIWTLLVTRSRAGRRPAPPECWRAGAVAAPALQEVSPTYLAAGASSRALTWTESCGAHCLSSS